jgi:hypothetical protein
MIPTACSGPNFSDTATLSKAPPETYIKGIILSIVSGIFFAMKQAQLPPGAYWIGDISYMDFLSDVVEPKDAQKDFHATNDFAFGSTAHGDGQYTDLNGNVYGVDGGIIGIAKYALGTEKENKDWLKDCLHLFTFTDPVSFKLDKGVFTITDGKQTVRIDTALADHEEEEEEECIVSKVTHDLKPGFTIAVEKNKYRDRTWFAVTFYKNERTHIPTKDLVQLAKKFLPRKHRKYLTGMAGNGVSGACWIDE